MLPKKLVNSFCLCKIVYISVSIQITINCHSGTYQRCSVYSPIPNKNTVTRDSTQNLYFYRTSPVQFNDNPNHIYFLHYYKERIDDRIASFTRTKKYMFLCVFFFCYSFYITEECMAIVWSLYSHKNMTNSIIWYYNIYHEFNALLLLSKT